MEEKDLYKVLGHICGVLMDEDPAASLDILRARADVPSLVRKLSMQDVKSVGKKAYMARQMQSVQYGATLLKDLQSIPLSASDDLRKIEDVAVRGNSLNVTLRGETVKLSSTTIADSCGPDFRYFGSKKGLKGADNYRKQMVDKLKMMKRKWLFLERDENGGMGFAFVGQ